MTRSRSGNVITRPAYKCKGCSNGDKRTLDLWKSIYVPDLGFAERLGTIFETEPRSNQGPADSYPTRFLPVQNNLHFGYLNWRNAAILKKLSDSLATTDLD